MSKAKHLRELDTLVHVFSHLKLTMHVHLFRLDVDLDAGFEPAFTGPARRKWVDADAMENQTLSTGMKRCWDLHYNHIATVIAP
jgi:A/G-specific adenine glycosylase